MLQHVLALPKSHVLSSKHFFIGRFKFRSFLNRAKLSEPCKSETGLAQTKKMMMRKRSLLLLQLLSECLFRAVAKYGKQLEEITRS